MDTDRLRAELQTAEVLWSTAEQRAAAAESERDRLRKRVTELEAERPHSFREEFAVRWAEDDYDPEDIEPVANYAAARRLAKHYPGQATPIRREVRELATAWREV